MIVDVATFESCVRALDDPRHAAAASSALEELRRSACRSQLLRGLCLQQQQRLLLPTKKSPRSCRR